MKLNLKVYLILIVVSFSILAFYFVARPGKNNSVTESSPVPIFASVSTDGWKNYINSDYGYSIEYPSNWYFSVVSSGTPIWVHFSPKPIPTSGVLDSPLIINFWNNQTEESTVNILRSQSPGADEKTVVVGNLMAHELYNSLGIDYIFPKGKDSIEIDTGQNEGATWNILSTIVSTFRFTN
ncbi:MAG TPA: hypothetical protein VG895_04280 [Patescibacteria group bacterium]|nr:hypothetical protein [Patescibacteria group bacterium]